MAENDSADWLSGLVSNSSANSAAHQEVSNASGHVADASAAVASSQADPLEAKDAALLQQVMGVLKTINLTPNGSIADAAAVAPIFFSTVPRRSSRAPLPLSPNSNPNHSTGTWSDTTGHSDSQANALARRAVGEKIKGMLLEGIASEASVIGDSTADGRIADDNMLTFKILPDARAPLGMDTGHRSSGTFGNALDLEGSASITNDRAKDCCGSVAMERRTSGVRQHSETRASSSCLSSTASSLGPSDAELMRMELLERKCRAQELLISRLYKDALHAEESLASMKASRDAACVAHSARQAEWERERDEWARECARLATQVQTTVRPLPNVAKVGGAVGERLVPLSSFVGFDGSRKTFVGLHEELHYTKGYNTALREEVERLKQALAGKDEAIVRLGDQLRHSYRMQASHVTSDVLLLSDRGRAVGPSRPCVPNIRSSSPSIQASDRPLADCILELIRARSQLGARDGRASRRPRGNSVSSAVSRRASPFRNTL